MTAESRLHRKSVLVFALIAVTSLLLYVGARLTPQDRTSDPKVSFDGVERATASLAKSVDAYDVLPELADRVDAGEITHGQAQALTTLAVYEGSYDEQSIVLQDTTKERAQEIANQLGAKLRITKSGNYARLTLPEGTTIVTALDSTIGATIVEEVEPDWHVSAASIVDDEGDSSGSEGRGGTDIGFDPTYDGDVSTITDVPMVPKVAYNDPYLARQSYLNYLNCAATLEVGSDETHAPLVAIIDTGIDTDNPEFEGRISEYSYNASLDKTVRDFGSDVIEDEQGHGTAVAGVLCAAVNNGVGIAGVAPNAQIMVIKANCDAKGEFKNGSDLVFGLYYAIERGADVVNMSFIVESDRDPFASAVKLAVDSDVFMVASAGNRGSSELCYPAANEQVMGVGALDADTWELASYSNFGDADLDIVAPGSVITSSHRSATDVVHASGTSLSAPLVTAAIARYKASHPHAENAELHERVHASAKDLGSPGEDWTYGYGALDVDALLRGTTGTITFDMLTDEVANIKQTFMVGSILQQVPEPERENLVFDGWYYDDQLSEPYDHLTDPVIGDADHNLTVYAGWTNEDEGQPFGYQAADGNDPNNGIEITGYAGKRKYVTIPTAIDGYTVIGIGKRALSPSNSDDGHGLSGGVSPISFALPDTLRYIGDSAFEYSLRLNSIRIPSGVESIGQRAFYGCSRLGSVIFEPNSALRTLGGMTFAYCPGIKSFTIPPSLEGFGADDLLGDSVVARIVVSEGNRFFAVNEGGDLTSMDGSILVYRPAALGGDYVVPSGIVEIGPEALAYSHARSVVAHEGLSEIGALAFAYSKVSSVTLPSTVSSLGSYSFDNCAHLSELDLSNTTIEVIGACSFMDCENLSSVLLPQSLKKIEEKAFLNDPRLESIYLPEGVEEIENFAFSETGLRRVHLPSSLVQIGESVFEACYYLHDVEFPDSCQLQTIPKLAFASTSQLTSLRLPEGITTIEEKAFSGSAITQVELPVSVNDIKRGAFASCSNLAHINVAEGNQTYAAFDDVLFSADQETLVFYPAGREGTSYAIPDSTKEILSFAFAGALNLKHCSVPDSIEELSAYAFSHAFELVSVSLPEGLTFIGTNCFEYCYQLSSIDVPTTVRGIGRYAFFADYALSEIHFAEGSELSRIGFGSMAYCGLRSIRIPSSVSTMGTYAFAGCTDLSTVVFDDGSKLDALPAYVFEKCPALTSIDFGHDSELVSLAARSLEGMGSLASVDLSGCASLREIGNYCFNRDYSLSSVTLASGVSEVGRYAFYGCDALESITLPRELSFIGRYAFTTPEAVTTLYFESVTLPAELQDDWNYKIKGYYLGTDNLEQDDDWRYASLDDGTVAAIAYLGSNSSVDATTIAGKPVSSIGYGCFRGNGIVQEVQLPDTLTCICDYAFEGCEALTNVSIPESVTLLGDFAFANTGVEQVRFADEASLTTIGNSAFEGDLSLASMALPASVTKLGRRAYLNSGIQSLAIPEDSRLETIGSYAFANSPLTQVSLPDGVKRIGSYAFYNATSLEQVDLGNPDDLKIDEHAFYGSGAGTILVPSGVSYIGELVFDAMPRLEALDVDTSNQFYASSEGVLYNKALTSLITYPAGRPGAVTIPRGVSSIRFGAFEGSRVGSVTFEAGSSLSTIGYRAFNKCAELTSVQGLSSNVTTIGRYAFAECPLLSSVDLADATSLGSIDRCAFYNCTSLTESFQLPDTVQEVGDKAFYGCTDLVCAIPSSSDIKAIGDSAFAHSGITSLDAPRGLLTIGKEAFRSSALSSANLDNGLLAELGTRAIYDCPDFSVSEMILPETVSYIGYEALEAGRDTIRSLTFPLPASLDAGAEFDLKYLFGGVPTVIEHVGISSAAELPEALFKDMTTLESLELPEDVDTIPNYFCSGCYGLRSVNIPDSIVSVGFYAFYGAPISNVSLPEGLKYIDQRAFCGTHLGHIALPDTLETIMDCAFDGASIDCVLDIPRSVSYISPGAFTSNPLMHLSVNEDNEHYMNLGENMVLTADGTELVWVYQQMEGTLVIPEGITTLYGPILEYLPNVTRIEFPSTIEMSDVLRISLTGNHSIESISLPGNIAGAVDLSGTAVKHVEIGEGATSLPTLRGCEQLLSLSIPSTVEHIDTSALEFCRNLVSIELSEGLKSIGDWAFADCSALQSIALPSTVESIGSFAFHGCSSLKTATLSEGLTTIGDEAFFDCTSLEELWIPSTVTTIGRSVYCGCDSLQSVGVDSRNSNYVSVDNSLYTSDYRRLVCVSQTSKDVTVPESVMYIDGAFQNARSLENVVLSHGISVIGGFSGAESLRSIHISDSVTTIESRAFDNCHNLEEVTGGSNLTSVGYLAFWGTALMNEAELSGEPLYIGNALIYVPEADELVIREGTRCMAEWIARDKKSLKRVVLPSSMEAVPESAFEDCESLEQVVFPEGIKGIGQYAFANTAIRSLDLPSTTTSVGYGSFAMINRWGGPIAVSGVLERIAFAAGSNAHIEYGAFDGQWSIGTVVLTAEMVNSSCERDILDSLPGKGRNDAPIDGLQVVLLDSVNGHVRDVDIEHWFGGGYQGADIYCYEDERSTTWHEGWGEGNTVHYLGSWNLATFKVDGITITRRALNAGQVVEIPSALEVRNALHDDCSFVMKGWDINGDGHPDNVPVTLNEATGDVVAEALFSTHVWGEDVIVDASCSEAGSITRTCTACGRHEVEEIKRLDHDWDEGVITEPTATEDGYTTFTCSRCGETDRRNWVIATDDVPGEWTVVEEPTCENEGLECRFSSSGHPVETRTLEAFGHAWDEGSQTVNPTCTEKGVMLYRCGHDVSHVRAEMLEPLGHDWGPWITVSEPTYEHDGLRRRECRRCERQQEDTLPQLEWVDAGGVIMSLSEITLEPGESINLVATLAHPDASDPSLLWLSDNSEYISVDQDGKVTGSSAIGYIAENPDYEEVANILVIASDGSSASCVVHLRHAGPGRVEEVDRIEPTCDQPGSLTRVVYCKGCSAELYREDVELPATGHIWGGEFLAYEPTCTQGGTYAHLCSVCGAAVVTRETDPLGHDYHGHTVEPTCTDAGWSDEWCSRCSDYRYTAIPPLGHVVPEEYTVDNEPSCTAVGYKSKHCTRCGNQIEGTGTSIAALGHDWGAWTVVREASEGIEGLRRHTCGRCGISEDDVIPALEHVHALKYVAEVTATCTTEGVGEHWACEGCGRLFSDPAGTNEVSHDALASDAIGHAFTNYVYNGNATCTQDGTSTAVCDHGCGATDSRTEVGSALGHDWDGGTVTTPATHEKPGVRTFACHRCDATRTEEIPKLEGSFFIDNDPTDGKNHGAEVDWMGTSGISTGWEVAGGREYRGMRDVTRCDFAAFLYRLADLSDDGERNDSNALSPSEVTATLRGVSDCDARTPHAAEVAWLVDSGISRGWPDKGKDTVSFRPMAKVARQDMAAFLYRFADIRDDGAQNGSLAMGPEQIAFSDVTHGDEDNHASDVEWLASVGVTRGWGPTDGTYQFRGTRTVARQDMAAFMKRLYDYLG